jgi:hypothetical protein
MKRLLAIVITVTYLALFLRVSFAYSQSGQPGSQELVFTVYLDDKTIGTHQVTISDSGTESEVVTEAKFKYSILLIPLYSYHLMTTEMWRDGCLTRMISRTDDNGDDYFVDARRSGDEQGLFLKTQNGSADISGCVKSFAYWDVEQLKADQLLNGQTGQYETTSLTSLGNQPLTFGEVSTQANKYILNTERFEIELWYSDDGEWLALQSVTESGGILRYIATHLVDSSDAGKQQS